MQRLQFSHGGSGRPAGGTELLPRPGEAPLAARPRETRVEVVDAAEEAGRERAADVGVTSVFGLRIVTVLSARVTRYGMAAT